METWVEEIEGWEDQPFSGGYDGLHDLAGRDFSGAVSTGGTWLFMVNGRVVAVVQHRQTRDGNEVVDADIERFEDGSGTVYEAPDPSIPLLVAMKTRDGETRGRYYSVKTPVGEVAETLEEGGFTGYVELSENVLSGDYYKVYQAGRSMDLAFIGNARRLLTDEEAHDRMADEVGIYEVVAVDLDVIEIPGDGGSAAAAGAGASGAAGAAGAGAAGAGAAGMDAGGGDTEPAEGTEFEPPAGDDGADGDEPTPTTSDATAAPEATDTTPTDEPATASTTDTASEGASNPDSVADQSPDTDQSPDDAVAASTDTSTDEQIDEQPDDQVDEETEVDPAGSEAVPAPGETGPMGAGPPDSASDQAQSVPSLDPDRSAMGTTSTASAADASADAAPNGSSPTPTADPDEMADLREELRTAREKLADARAELEATREERDDLAARIEELQARISELESGGGTTGPSLSAAEAFAGTSLLVRYGSKGDLTVEDAHDGAGDRDDLLENLQLDWHTQFESAGVTVDGQPFDDWLAATDRFRFTRWLVSALVFEIRETGSVDALRELYDALPEVDRIELDGSVTVDGEEGEEALGFDVVMRNRMGEPLVVATLEDSREPVAEAAMADLVNDASAVVQSHEPLAGAFYVTTAFFAPEALETAREATSGSLLSRDRRKSYVKLSRTRGYHLALVESREETFRLSVPDL